MKKYKLICTNEDNRVLALDTYDTYDDALSHLEYCLDEDCDMLEEEGFTPKREEQCVRYGTENLGYFYDIVESDEYIRIPKDKLDKACKCLFDNGVAEDEAETVLQALGYILLDEELYPKTHRRE